MCESHLFIYEKGWNFKREELSFPTNLSENCFATGKKTADSFEASLKGKQQRNEEIKLRFRIYIADNEGGLLIDIMELLSFFYLFQLSVTEEMAFFPYFFPLPTSFM